LNAVRLVNLVVVAGKLFQTV